MFRDSAAQVNSVPRLRNDLYYVEWDVKLYYTIPYHTRSGHGANPVYVRTANLYVIRCWTGNQCCWCSNGLAWDRLNAWSTIRAALFRTRCSFWIVRCRSVRREAQRCSSRSWTGSSYMLTSVLTPSTEGLYDRSGDGKHCHKTAWGCIVLAYSVIAWGFLCSWREDSGVAVQATAMRRHL